jgi:exonuclease V gamma subunit
MQARRVGRPQAGLGSGSVAAGTGKSEAHRRNEALHGSALLAERAETYRRLLAEALPFARVELAWMRQRRSISDEPGMLRNIQAAFASTAMIRGEPIEATIARLWGALAETRRAA